MTRKEDLDRVRQIYNSDLNAKKVKELQEISDFEKREVEKLRQKQLDELKLKATGVVDLFQEIRDSRIVVYNNKPRFEYEEAGFFRKARNIKVSDYNPAIVNVCGNNAKLIFNHFGVTGGSYSENYIEARINENDLLIIKGQQEFVVGPDLILIDAVGLALVEPKKYEYKELSY